MSAKKENKCVGCGSPYVVNRTHMMCDACNYFRMHGKTRLEALKASNHTNISPTKRNTVKPAKKRSNTLLKDRETYYEVFKSKPHQCEECGCELPDVFEDENGNIVSPAQYSHILTKAAWPEFRHNPKNFNRLCFNHHRQWEDGNRSVMNIYNKNQQTIQTLFNERSPN